MTDARLIVSILLMASLTACGGAVDLTCDEVRTYQLVGESKRVTAPEDLDGLEPLREIPLPEASPRPPRPEGSPCLDLPPSTIITD